MAEKVCTDSCCLWQAAAPSQKADGREEQAQSAQPRGPRQPWWTGVMDRRFVGSFEPLAAWLKSQVSAGGGFCACCTHCALGLPLIPVWMSAFPVTFCRVTVTQRWSQHDSHLHGCSLDDLHPVSPAQHCARSSRMADKLPR